METVVIAYIIAVIGCLTALSNYRSLVRLKSSIPEILVESIKTLEPGNRYIITLPSSMTDAEFDAAFDALNDHLDLKNSNTYVVVLHGNIKIVEFS